MKSAILLRRGKPASNKCTRPDAQYRICNTPQSAASKDLQAKCRNIINFSIT